MTWTLATELNAGNNEENREKTKTKNNKMVVLMTTTMYVKKTKKFELYNVEKQFGSL